MSPTNEPSVYTGRLYLYFFASLIFVAGATVIFWPWLSGAVTIPWDAKAQAYSQLGFLARTLAAGDSPFWTPNVFTGHPQIADPQSLIFSPPFLLLALFNPAPSFRAADAVPFVMLVLGGLSIIGFFRDRRWHPAGALVAAFAFSFGGSNAWRLQHVGEVLSLCWFALTLFALARGLDRGSILAGFLAGVLAGFMALGRDQIAMLCIFILAAYAVTFVLGDLSGRLKRSLPVLSAGFIGGVLTIGIPIALTLALADESNRPEIDYAGAIGGSLPPFSLLSAVVANLFGVDGPMKDFWGPPAELIWGPSHLALARNMGAIYFGAIPLAALACGFASLRETRIRIFAVLAIIMLLYAVGSYTPFFGWVFEIPGVALYRRPADATFPLCALLAICAGYGVHILALRGGGMRLVWGAVIVAALYALCVGVAIDKDRFAQSMPALITGAVALSCAMLVLLLAPVLARRAPVALILLIGFGMTVDLSINNKPNESTAASPLDYEILRFGSRDETLVRMRALLAEQRGPDRRDRVELAAIDYNWPNAGLVHNFDHDLGFNPVRLKLFVDVTHAQDQIAIPDQRTFSPLYAGFKSPLADLMGVRLVLSRYPLGQLDPTFRESDFISHGQINSIYIWENPRALPRVMMVGSAQAVNFESLTGSGNWPKVDFTQTVLLESDDILEPRSRPKGEARILRYRNTQIDIEVNSPEGGWLVLNDIWHPWWQAKVDGAEASILQANVMFRAVAVPAGQHRVQFTFHPLSGLWNQLRER